MSLDNTKLFGLLEIIDKETPRKITLVAAGGTAMTLLNLKPSTIDIDFTAPAEDARLFNKIQMSIPHGFTIQCFEDGAVFVNMLPDDYLTTSIPIKTKTKNIKLRALHPVDIVVTKIGRLEGRDMQDIESCIKNSKLNEKQIVNRSKQLLPVSLERKYQKNLQIVKKQFFGR